GVLNGASGGEGVIVRGDQLALELSLIGPAEFLKAAVKGEAIIAAVDLVRGLEWRDGRYAVRHVGRRDEIAATELDTIETQVLRDHVQQALPEKIRLEATRSPIGADRCLVRHPQRGFKLDVADPIRPRHDLRDSA